MSSLKEFPITRNSVYLFKKMSYKLNLLEIRCFRNKLKSSSCLKISYALQWRKERLAIKKLSFGSVYMYFYAVIVLKSPKCLPPSAMKSFLPETLKNGYSPSMPFVHVCLCVLECIVHSSTCMHLSSALIYIYMAI